MKLKTAFSIKKKSCDINYEKEILDIQTVINSNLSRQSSYQ